MDLKIILQSEQESKIKLIWFFKTDLIINSLSMSSTFASQLVQSWKTLFERSVHVSKKVLQLSWLIKRLSILNFNILEAVNEPIKGYLPGSPEKISLKAKLNELKSYNITLNYCKILCYFCTTSCANKWLDDHLESIIDHRGTIEKILEKKIRA